MLKKLNGNDRGATSVIERGFMFIVIFVIFSFAIDVVLLAGTMITASHQLTYAADKCEFQNGFLGNGRLNPNDKVWTNNDFQQYLSKGLAAVGVDGINYPWSLTCIHTSNGGTTHVVCTGTTCDSSHNCAGNFLTKAGQLKDSSYHYGDMSTLQLTYTHFYRFSGKIFYMSHKLSEINLTRDFNYIYVF